MKKENLDIEISAVILSFNSNKYIEKCIRSLFNSFEECHLYGEIHVVDNGSNDGSVEILKKLQKEFANNLNVIFQEENIGTTRSRNMALKKSHGRFILIIDSDAYMNSESLRNLIEYKNDNVKVGLVAPGLTYPDGRFQMSVDVFPTLLRKVKRYYSLRSLEKNYQHKMTGRVDYAISACWLLKNETVRAVGLLDERIFYSPEDVDYCIRVWKSGYEVHYLPQVKIIHDAQEISRPKGMFINKFTVRHIKGLAYLFFKHKYIFSLRKLRKEINKIVI